MSNNGICDFSRNLRIARKNAGLTQQQLADKICVKYETISSYENLKEIKEIKEIDEEAQVTSMRRKFPTLFTAQQISKCLGVSLDWLCGLPTIPKNEVLDPDKTIKKTLILLADIIEGKYKFWEVKTSIVNSSWEEFAELAENGVSGNEYYSVGVTTTDERLKEFAIEYKETINSIKEVKGKLQEDIYQKMLKEATAYVLEKHLNNLCEKVNVFSEESEETE